MKKTVSILLVAILSLPVATVSTFAQLRKFKKHSAKQKAKRSKLAPDLVELLTQDDEVERTGQNRGLQRLQRIAHTPRPVFSGGTLPATETPAETAQSFIVQLEETTPDVVLREKLAQVGGRVVRKYNQIGLVKIEASRKAIRSIAADTSIAYVSPDRVTKSHGHVDTTTGAAIASISTSTTSCLLGLLCSTSTTTTALDGTGIGIAILDSGVDDNHKSFTGKDGQRRVTEIDYNNDELDPDKDDKFGHGTHVAALAAAYTEQQSYPSRVRGKYNGVAKNAYLYNLRVLNEEGLGKT